MLQRDLREQHPLTEAPVVLRPVSQGRGRACHASDADGTSAEKVATIIQISHNVNVSHARSPTLRATREGVSTKRGTNLRDRKEKGVHLNRRRGRQAAGGVCQGIGGCSHPCQPTRVRDRTSGEGAGDKTMERSGNSLAVARPGEALQRSSKI